MTKKARTPSELEQFFEDHLRGRSVEQVLVHGFNSLKTLSPPLSALAGEIITSYTQESDAIFTLGVGGFVLRVDLQRVGALSWAPSLVPWTIGKPSMPTGQILLEGGGGIQFVEPSKTKRITFTLYES